MTPKKTYAENAATRCELLLKFGFGYLNCLAQAALNYHKLSFLSGGGSRA